MNRNTETARRQRRQDLLLIFAVAVIFRMILLLLFPVPYGNDAAGRLFYRDTLLIAHWLPLTQTIVYLGYELTNSVMAVRLFFAVLTALTPVAITFYLTTIFNRRAALLGGLLFALNPFFIFLSLMPYQEMPFMGLLLGSLAFLGRAEMQNDSGKNFLIGSVLFGLACLTRYEAWFILPALFLVRIVRNFSKRTLSENFRRIALAFIGLGWWPLLWMLINYQVSGNPVEFLFLSQDQPSHVWNPRGEMARIFTYWGNMLYWLVRFGSPLILLAIPGSLVLWKKRKSIFPFLWPLLLLLLIQLIFLTFFASEAFETANRFVTIPLTVALIFMALGADALLQWLQTSPHKVLERLRAPGPKRAAAGFIALCLVVYGAQPVVKANYMTEYRSPYNIARYLEANLKPGERVVIVAEQIADEVPQGCQRLIGQMALEKSRFICSALLSPQTGSNPEEFARDNRVRYIVVYRGGWEQRGGDAGFVQFVNDSNSKIRKKHQFEKAVVYELSFLEPKRVKQ